MLHLRRYLLPVLLLCFSACLFALVNPIGNFPLNDDWSYGKAVQNLVVNKQLQFTGWVAMPLIPQVLWGALFSIPFGFSFTALRLSTLTLSLMGILATYGFLREAQLTRPLAFFGALIVAVNPIYFELSHTFMTDIPFYAGSMISLSLLIRGIRLDNVYCILFGFAWACVASLIRQVGIVIPFAFAVGYLVKNGFTRKSVGLSVLGLALVYGELLLYYLWIQPKIVQDTTLSHHTIEFLFTILKSIRLTVTHLVVNSAIALFYLGLFTLPLLIFILPTFWQSLARPKKWACVAFSAFCMVALLWIEPTFSLWSNIFYNFGLGPVTLFDVHILKYPHVFSLPYTVLMCIGILGIIAALVLLWTVFFEKNQPPTWLKAMNLAGALLYFLPLGITHLFDRYILFLLPLTLAFIGYAVPKETKLAWGSPLIAVYAIFSLLATHDYLSWNRVRWMALNELVYQDDVSPTKIDGGFEFNGWYLYDPSYVKQKGKSWWWVQDNDYVIAMGPMEGYQILKQYPYSRWMPGGDNHIYLLKANESEGEVRSQDTGVRRKV